MTICDFNLWSEPCEPSTPRVPMLSRWCMQEQHGGWQPPPLKEDPARLGETLCPLYGTTTMHAAALFVAWGAKEVRQFFDQLKANQVHLASSNGEVKRLVTAGEVAFGLTDTDDAHQALGEGPLRWCRSGAVPTP